MNGKSEAELRKLPRAKIQKLAKAHGIKANIKTEAIITELLHVFSKEESHNSTATAGPERASPVAGPPTQTTQSTALDAAQSAGPSRPRMLVAMKKPPKGAKLPTGMTAEAGAGPSPPLRRISPPVLVRAPTPSGSGGARAPNTRIPAPNPSRPFVMPSLGVFRPPSATHPRVFFPPAPKSPGRDARPAPLALPPPPPVLEPQPEASQSASSASRAPHPKLPPVSTLLAEVGPVPAHVLRTRDRTSSPAASDHTRTTASGSIHNEQIPYLPDGFIPEHTYSVSTGIPPGVPVMTSADKFRQFNARIRLILDGPNPPPQSDGPSDPIEYQDDCDLDFSGPLPPIIPSRAPTDATNVWTPSTPPRSRAGPAFRPLTARPTSPGPEEMPPYESPSTLSPVVPDPDPPLQPRRERLASEKQVKAVVAKMADISAMHKACWEAANTFEPEIEFLAGTLDGMRTLIRQSRAQRERMALWLSYRNPDQPDWEESEFWPQDGRTYRTRLDEEGREVEVTSEDEAAGLEQGQLLTTANRGLVTPEPKSRKRRRNTPAAALIFGQRPSKKMRGDDGQGDAAQPAPAPAPGLGAISEDQEEEE